MFWLCPEFWDNHNSVLGNHVDIPNVTAGDVLTFFLG